MYTIRYETDDEVTGQPKEVQHQTGTRRVIELFGRSLVRRAEAETVWNIAVLDEAGDDVTFEFACFQG